MKVVALIPARYQSSRFSGKLMANLAGKPVILRTYQAVVDTSLFEEVIVVSDSEEIINTIKNAGGKAIKSQKEHSCGTDRIAEAAEQIEADVILNVQGDEPFTNKKSLSELLDVFRYDEDERIDLASLMQKMKVPEQIEDPNYVKVIVNQENDAIYFSRSPIPYQRNKEEKVNYYEHIGVYAFRKQALLDFYHSPATPLEKVELIECLRYIEMGKTIKMVETEYMGIEIDTPEDLKNAQIFLSE